MKFTKKILPNGLRVITVPMNDNPAVTVLVMVQAGSKYENKEVAGVSHFLEHMCFKGTKKRPKAVDISKELDSIGAQYNAFTSQEYTGYYAKSDPAHLDTILDVVSDMYLNPLFEKSEIEKEKGVIVEEINMYEDMPDRNVQDIFMEVLYKDQPAGANIAGSRETVRGMKREDFVKYRDNHYVASSTIVIVSGTFEESSIYTKIEEKFGQIKNSEKLGKLAVIEKQDEPNIMVKFKETDQTHLVLGVRSFDIKSEWNPVLKVMGVILGGGMSSRLFQKLRDEMGVGYYVSASNDSFTDHGVFSVSTGVDNKRVFEVIKAIINEFKKLTRESVGQDELKKAKDYIIGNMKLGLETSDARAMYFGFQEVLKNEVKSLEDLILEIGKVTSENIMELAKIIFTNQRLNLAIIGHFESDKELKKIVTFTE
jgi:predicted Zn-dependent peptidase